MSNKNIGSSFDDFLAKDATLDGAITVAMKRVIAWQTKQEMNVLKTEQDLGCERGGGAGEEVEGGVVGGLKIYRMPENIRTRPR